MAFASLTIDLNARLAQFETDLGKVAHLAERNAQQMERAFSRVSGVLAALGAGISVGALVAGIKDLIGSAAGLDELAAKTGASVEELSKLEQVARISGTSLETVEMGMIRLSKALHGGDDEAKGAGKALAALGLKAEELAKLGTAEAYRAVAVEINKWGDSSGKTALMLDLLGRSGAQQLPFIKALGVESGITSHVTAELAAAALELEKALGRLGNASHNAYQEMALGLVPILSNVIEQFNEAKRVAGGVASALFLMLRTNTDDPGKQIEEINRKLKVLAETRADLSKDRFANRLNEAIFGDVASIDRQTRFFEAQKKLLLLAQQQQALASTAGMKGRLDAKDPSTFKPPLNYASDVEKLDKLFQEQMKRLRLAQLHAEFGENEFIKMRGLLAEEPKLKALPEPQKQELLDAAALAEQIKNLRQQDKEREEGLGEIAKAVSKESNEEIAKRNEIRKSIIDLVDPIEKYRQKILEVEKALELGDISPAVAAAALLHWNEQIEAAEGLDKKVKQTFDDMTQFAVQAAHNMQNAMADGFFDLMQGKFDNLGDRFKQLIDRMVANLLASQLNNFLFGKDFGTTNVLGGALGKLIENFGASAPVAAPIVGAGGIGVFDVGTPFVPRDMLALIHRGERITPAAQNRPQAWRGQPFVQHVHFHGITNGDTFKASQYQILSALGAATAAAMRRNQ